MIQWRRKEGLQLQSLELRKSCAQNFISMAGVVSIFGKKEIMALAIGSRLPAILTNSDRVVAGGLMSYDRNIANLYHWAATYVDKILKGAGPADQSVYGRNLVVSANLHG